MKKFTELVDVNDEGSGIRTVKGEPGETIFHAARRAIELAKDSNPTFLLFNEIEVPVSGRSCPSDIGLIYQLMHKLRKHNIPLF